MKKAALTLVLIFLCVSLLSSQSLIELAAKEKTRRAAIRSQGKSASVVTNAHLRKYTKTVRVSSGGFESPSDEKNTTTQPKRPVSPVRVTVRDSGKKSDSEFQMPQYATKIFSETRLVENPAAALKRPDGATADICLFGILDLEIEAKNGPGDDIAIFLHRIDGQDHRNMQSSEGIPTSNMGFQYWGGYWYGVLGLGEKGDWVFLGQGTGVTNPEKFDLGDLSTIKRLRIMFKPSTNADFPMKLPHTDPEPFTFNIDAVQVLH